MGFRVHRLIEFRIRVRGIGTRVARSCFIEFQVPQYRILTGFGVRV